MRESIMKSTCFTIALIVLIGMPAVSSHAVDDGGTRSVFAHGAGNRALAMGGAFTAVADDASAPVWNPAGLGIVSRREFQASRATLYGLDMSEEYVAFVLPSWRYGVAAVTFRHFGVSGIEGRDNRNVITNENLSNSDTEISLSYGRSLGSALSLGGSLKLQRQSLASLNATGIGADFGLLAQPADFIGMDAVWAQRVTLGLYLRNLVEPSLRLDTETVRDPLTFRIGAAYRHHFFSGSIILATVDLERSRDINTRLHSGLEFRVHPLVSLRTGLSAMGPTAGMRTSWRGMAIDYAFEDNDLASIHRVGLTVSFGATVEERRLAALHAEEEALQARLGEEFERKQAERTTTLMAQADEARSQSRYDDALELLAVATTLSPGIDGAREMEALCWRSKAAELESSGELTEAALAYGRVLAIIEDDAEATEGVARCRAEGDRRAARSAEVRERFTKALDAFGAGDLVAASEGFGAVLEIDPEDHEAAAMLGRTREAIDRRLDELIDQGRRLARGGLYAEASEAISMARDLDPSSASVRDARQYVVDLMNRSAQQASMEPRIEAPPAESDPIDEVLVEDVRSDSELTPQEKREVENLYKRGIAALEADRPEDAIRYWELALSTDPNHQQVKEYLKREYLMGGMDLFAIGRLDEAVTHWENALRVDPTDEKAKGYLARAQQQLNRTREILGGGR